MASTNKTTNYELSQYIGTDKPTYLTDYNQDMAKIDAGIHAAKVEADTNATNIGDLTNLTTTTKTSSVAAINELDSDLGTLSTTVGNHTTAIADNTSHIGDLTNLSTTAKNNLVSAVNEVDSQANTNTAGIQANTTAINNLANKFNFTDFTQYTTGTLSNGSLVTCDITVATNSDKSICKIYGQVATNDGNSATITLPTTFSVDEAFTVSFSGINFNRNSFTLTGFGSITFNTNGTISLSVGNGTNLSYYIPTVIFVSDFGDTPQN